MATEKRTLEDLFVDELADLHDAELQLVKALPKMVKAAESEELQAAFEEHLELTRQHAERVGGILEELEGRAKSKKCKGMSGLVAEGEEIAKDNKNCPTIDAALIAAAQRVEHYEIAGYGTVVAYARRLGHVEAADILEEILEEEKEANDTLTDLAETSINQEAQVGEPEP